MEAAIVTLNEVTTTVKEVAEDMNAEGSATAAECTVRALGKALALSYVIPRWLSRHL